jgi:hypothetical protein
MSDVTKTITVRDIEIEVPKESEAITALVESLGDMSLCRLARFQKQPKLWPNHTNIPSYCLYMGSAEIEGQPFDFYHYESGSVFPHYSGALVFEEWEGGYASHSYCLRIPEYREQFRREYLCGVLTVDDMIHIASSVLTERQKGDMEGIRPARERFQPGEEREHYTAKVRGDLARGLKRHNINTSELAAHVNHKAQQLADKINDRGLYFQIKFLCEEGGMEEEEICELLGTTVKAVYPETDWSFLDFDDEKDEKETANKE